MPDILEPVRSLMLTIMEFFHGSFGSWGLAIILLTLLVRLALLPLTIRQTRSMKAMQAVGPKLKELQEKYKHDKQKLQQEMLRFYSENKINPLAGCLPILPQIPIMIALFQMLMGSKDLRGAGFLWISDLSKAPEPILMSFMIASTYFSQWMVATDPQQKRMMLPMALVMGVIGLSLPAGVLLYWVTTNLWTIGQQYVQFRGGKGPQLAGVAPAPAPAEEKGVEKSEEGRRVARRKR